MGCNRFSCSKGTKTIHVAVHHFANSSVFVNLDSVVHKVNAAFEGPIDTSYFTDSLVYKGVRKLEGITFLQANPNGIVQGLSRWLPDR